MKKFNDLVDVDVKQALHDDRKIRQLVAQIMPPESLAHVQFCRIENRVLKPESRLSMQPGTLHPKKSKSNHVQWLRGLVHAHRHQPIFCKPPLSQWRPMNYNARY